MSEAIEFYGIQIPVEDIKLPSIVNIINNQEKPFKKNLQLKTELSKIKSTLNEHKDIFIDVIFDDYYGHITECNYSSVYILVGEKLNCSKINTRHIYTDMDPATSPKLNDVVLVQMKTFCELLQINNAFESYTFKYKIIHKVV